MSDENTDPSSSVNVPNDFDKGSINTDIRFGNELQNQVKYASVVYRYAALMLDGLVLSPIMLVFGLFSYGISPEQTQNSSVELLASLFVIFYFVYYTKTYQATLGKKFFKLKIVTVDDTEMSWGKALKRELLGKFLSGLILNLGYLWALFDKKKQGWHDKIAGTVVVQTQEPGTGRKLLAYFLTFGLFILAILGILAVVVLVAINPQEQLRKARESADKQQTNFNQDKTTSGSGLSQQVLRTRDAARISSVVLMGHAVEAYYTSHNEYPNDNTWTNDLIVSGEIANIPDEVTFESGSGGCFGGYLPYQGWCYKTRFGENAIVYTGLESNTYLSKCSSGERAYILYSTADARSGVWCGTVEPEAGSGFSYEQN